MQSTSAGGAIGGAGCVTSTNRGDHSDVALTSAPGRFIFAGERSSLAAPEDRVSSKTTADGAARPAVVRGRAAPKSKPASETNVVIVQKQRKMLSD